MKISMNPIRHALLIEIKLPYESGRAPLLGVPLAILKRHLRGERITTINNDSEFPFQFRWYNRAAGKTDGARQPS
jgi:hypothetical protein